MRAARPSTVPSARAGSVGVLAAGAIAGFLARRRSWLMAQRDVMGSVLGTLAFTLALDTSGPA
ncbi:hypothetical protein [Streptomyces sp. NBC_01264]|uniref:hypothetical protein n=1 Tax=Streptomyces sp. NBC_01264 TaxID=2903804 RepID=UPI002255026E|nr:hypothetical protein [Streptomyces sp. NBC_01264]MCX4779639.1 hypothetical protein [Streptomyces sp. NBC_01264]